ncbi:MAG: PEP phosphonomutase [Tissierellia bacterium]|nr:PEP phosphonomutase [Tissierellia bacterium]
MTDNKKILREKLKENDFFTLPGIYDCLGAKIAESLGFDALYLSGGALSLAALGRPDSGYLNLTDLRMVLERVLSTVDIPVITDTDNSFGNAMHAADTAKTLERMGVCGLQIDDNILPQPKPENDKEVISWDLLAPKLEAIRKSTSDDFVMILRTIIGKTEGIEKAVERASKAADLGVDYVFIEGFNSVEEMEYATIESRANLMVNLNENTFAATVDIEKVRSMGFKIGFFPISTIHVAAKAMYDVLSLLKEKGTTMEMKSQMIPYSDLMRLYNFYDDVEKYSKLYK